MICKALWSVVPFALICVAAIPPVTPQSNDVKIKWQPQNSGLTASCRGLSAVSDRIVWVSGSQSSYASTTDGGTTWVADTVKSGLSLDFRDVEAIDANTAYLMGAGPGERSRIYKTVDGGKTWTLQFTNPYPEGFFNGMAFWDADNGIAVSDPVGGKLLLMKTTNGGKEWSRIPPENLPPILEGEYGFAASGTGIAVFGDEHVWIATGGAAARVFRSADRGSTWRVTQTPIVSGTPSSGIFSIAFRDAQNGLVVGGDYQNPRFANGNVARTTDGGASWTLIAEPKSVAFKSCAAYVPNSKSSVLVTLGTSGSNYSTDDGLTWVRLDSLGYNTLSLSPSGKVGWAAGAEGRIAKLVIGSPN